MDSERFDRFAKALAGRLFSRRVVTKGIAATAMTGVPAIGSSLDGFARRRKRKKKQRKQPLSCTGDSCDGTGGKPCGKRDNCQCYRAAKGDNVCASSLQSSLDQTCTTTKDCPRGHVCVEGGPACGGRGLRFCKRACYA